VNDNQLKVYAIDYTFFVPQGGSELLLARSPEDAANQFRDKTADGNAIVQNISEIGVMMPYTEPTVIDVAPPKRPEVAEATNLVTIEELRKNKKPKKDKA
jgi:hypothetical protein